MRWASRLKAGILASKSLQLSRYIATPTPAEWGLPEWPKACVTKEPSE